MSILSDEGGDQPIKRGRAWIWINGQLRLPLGLDQAWEQFPQTDHIIQPDEVVKPIEEKAVVPEPPKEPVQSEDLRPTFDLPDPGKPFNPIVLWNQARSKKKKRPKRRALTTNERIVLIVTYFIVAAIYSIIATNMVLSELP